MFHLRVRIRNGVARVGGKVKILLLTLLLVSSAVAADGWRRVGISRVSETQPVRYYDFKEGSCKQDVNSSGTHIILCMERVTNTHTGNSTFDWIGTNVADCEQGYGTVLTLDFNGNVLGKDQTVKGGGTIAATEFELLCNIATGVIT
jgi:hypothetical protein